MTFLVSALGRKRGIKYIFGQNVFLVNMTRVQNSGKSTCGIGCL